MILYFSSDKNIDIFNISAEEVGLNIKYEKETLFSDYINKNINSLMHIEFLVIDLDYIIDEDEELLKTLASFRTLNSKTSIIIVALGRQKGDILLGKLFSEGIYNFITSNDELLREQEIKSCLDKNINNYANALLYKPDKTDAVKQEKETNKKGIINNIFRNLKKEKTEKAKIPKNKFKHQKEPQKNIYYEPKKEIHIEEKPLETIKIEEDLPIEEDLSIKEDAEKLIQNKVNDIFGNNNFETNNTKQGQIRENMELVYINDTIALFFYYRKAIGVYDKNPNSCVIDSIFQKSDIQDYFKSKNILLFFKDNTLEKVKELNRYIK